LRADISPYKVNKVHAELRKSQSVAGGDKEQQPFSKRNLNLNSNSNDGLDALESAFESHKNSH